VGELREYKNAGGKLERMTLLQILQQRDTNSSRDKDSRVARWVAQWIARVIKSAHGKNAPLLLSVGQAGNWPCQTSVGPGRAVAYFVFISSSAAHPGSFLGLLAATLAVARWATAGWRVA